MEGEVEESLGLEVEVVERTCRVEMEGEEGAPRWEL